MVDLAKRRRLAQIAQEKANPVPAAMRVVPALLYGAEHAYGNPITGSGYERTVSTLTRDDLVKWHRDWFHPGNATVIVTGDTTMSALLPELERAFSGWKAGQAPAKKIQPVPATPGKRVYLMDQPGAPQSVIVAAHVSEPGGHAEDLAIETVMRNFGGIATSRLNRNLRLDKHWSYGTTALLQDARGQRPFIVIAPVQTDKTKESIVEVMKELDGIAGARPIRGEEFESIMRTQTLGLPGRWATLAALEAAAIQILNYRYPDDYFSTYARRVRALGEPDARRRGEEIHQAGRSDLDRRRRPRADREGRARAEPRRGHAPRRRRPPDGHELTTAAARPRRRRDTEQNRLCCAYNVAPVAATPDVPVRRQIPYASGSHSNPSSDGGAM